MWTGFLPILVSIAWAEYIPPGPAYRCPVQLIYLYPCLCIGEADVGISISCENSNLASIGVGLSNLALQDTPIENLVIGRSNIGRLYGSLLHGLKVNDFKIIETPIRKVEDHVFFGVNETLRFVTFVNTTLETYPAEAFKILGIATHITLDGHNISKLDDGSFGGNVANTLERLRIVNGKISEIPNDLFGPLRRLKTLDFHGNTIKDLKRNQFKGLRDLEVLDLSHNKLKKLDSSHLADLTKLGWCNVSHNELKELTRGTFARNTVLKVLNLSHNMIKKLDGNSFRGMRFIRRLFFSDNEITDIGRGTFSSVSRIGTIDLARNKIKKIDYQMFFQLNFVELVDVSENEVTEIQKLAFKDLYLTTINVSHNAIAKVEAGSFENCANITFLDMSYNNISTFPKTAFDGTTYATTLYVPFNQLKSLSDIPLQNMTGLKIINASYNEITTVPKNTFPKLYELHTIDFSHNNISTLHNGVFQVLFSLRFLDLSHNNLKRLRSSVFGALPTLLSLDIRQNNLVEISRGALTRLASLRELKASHNNLTSVFQIPISLSHLDISYNNISEISDSSDTWPVMNSLLSLNLSHNSLRDSLRKGSFKGLLSLSTLKLSNNGIQTPPGDALSDLSSLQYLHLEGNEIEEIKKNAFGRLPIVFDLNLSGNNIKNIENRAFEGLLQLLTLNVSFNNVTRIPNGAFQGLVSLRTLDLSHNLLEKIDNKTHGLLDDCLSLERVNLSHNRISFTTLKTFPSDPYIPYKLKEIDLSFNTMPVVTMEITVGTKKVQYLNLSHNSITEIRTGVLGNLTSLQVLDLSDNQISNLRDAFAKPPVNLTAVYLSRNSLNILPTEHFVKMKPIIRTLALDGNKLTQFPVKLVTLLENKTDINIAGNPISCDCFVRPLRRFLNKQLEIPDHWNFVTCPTQNSEGKLPITVVTELELPCPESLTSVNETFDVTPDITFRDITFPKKGSISIQWLVSSKRDVADFYIFIQEEDRLSKEAPITIFEKLIAYTERKVVLHIDEVKTFIQQSGLSRPRSENMYRLCIISVDSLATPGELFERQCKKYSYNSIKQFLASSSPSRTLFSWMYCILLAIFLFYI